MKNRGGTALLLTLIALLAPAGTLAAFPVEPAAVDTLPEPGAMFVGEIDMQDVAESGEIEFQISEDGTQLSSGLTITVVGVKIACSPLKDYTTTISPIWVKDAAFREESRSGVIEGTFVSPTSARGTFQYVELDYSTGYPPSVLCDHGVVTWTAEVVAP